MTFSDSYKFCLAAFYSNEEPLRNAAQTHLNKCFSDTNRIEFISVRPFREEKTIFCNWVNPFLF